MLQSAALTTGQYQSAFGLLKEAVLATGAGKAIWNKCNESGTVHLVFKETKLGDDEYAVTKFYLGSDDIYKLDSTPDWLTEGHRKGTLRIETEVNPEWEGAAHLGRALEILVHEFTLHAADWGYLIAALQDDELDLQTVNKFRSILMKALGGLLTANAGHYLLASGSSLRFNAIAKYLEARSLSSKLPPDTYNAFKRQWELDVTHQKTNEFPGMDEHDIFKPAFANVQKVTYPRRSGTSLVDDPALS
jgi:hypothetical protein